MKQLPNRTAAGKHDQFVSNFGRHVGITIRTVRAGYAVAEMNVVRKHLNRAAMAHGGAIFTLADKAFAAASNYHSSPVVALQASISYMRPGRAGDTLIAVAEELRRGRRTAVYEIKIYSKKPRVLIALMTSTGFILDA